MTLPMMTDASDVSSDIGSERCDGLGTRLRVCPAPGRVAEREETTKIWEGDTSVVIMRTVHATRPICAAFKQVVRIHFRGRSTTATTAAGDVRTYKEIPRASALPYLFGLIKHGTSMPALQKLLEERITQCARTHGLLYRDSVPQFMEYVMVLDPHDVEQVWRVEGRWPYKADFLSVLKDARKDREVHGGLLGT